MDKEVLLQEIANALADEWGTDSPALAEEAVRRFAEMELTRIQRAAFFDWAEYIAAA